MQITIVNGIGPTDVQAHKAGCADLKKHTHQDQYTAEYASQREAFLDYNADFIDEDDETGGWAIDFAHCTRGLPATV